jgi:hypothetical protein
MNKYYHLTLCCSIYFVTSNIIYKVSKNHLEEKRSKLGLNLDKVCYYSINTDNV